MFETKAKQCAMGDLKAMLWMFRHFDAQLSEAYKAYEKHYVEDPSELNLRRRKEYLEEHEEERLCLQASHMWIVRAALFGSEEAKRMIAEYPFYARDTYMGVRRQIPGRMISTDLDKSMKGSDMRKIGFLEFKGNGMFTLYPISSDGIYTVVYDAGDDGPDETGFGMEELYNYYYYDEFFRYLHGVKNWSSRDVWLDREKIAEKNLNQRDMKQQERDAYWKDHRNAEDMERYHLLARKTQEDIYMGDILAAHFPEQNPAGDKRHFIIPDGIKEIETLAFNDCKEIESIQIPDSVTSIGIFAFHGCESLKNFCWPETIAVMPPGAFYMCTGLEQVTLPDGIEMIPPSAFEKCKSLKRIVIPASVKVIGSYAFRYCSSLEEVVLQGKPQAIGRNAFMGCSKLKRINLPDGIRKIWDCTFEECKSLKRIVIPSSVEVIESEAFRACSSLEEVVLQGEPYRIEYRAFMDCGQLQRINLTQRTKIEKNTFCNCEKLVL